MDGGVGLYPAWVRLRRLSFLLAVALTAASCGVSRDDTATGPDGTGSDTTGTTVAGGDASGDSTPTTAELPPATTAADDEVAVDLVFADGSTGQILHGELNKLAVPVKGNQEFIDLIYDGTAPSGLEAILLSQDVWSKVLENEITRAGSSTSDQDRAEAKKLVFEQLAARLTDSTDPAADSERLYGEVPYLAFIVELQARQLALSNALKAKAPATDRFPCVSHILVDTPEDADKVVADLAAGGDFATIAKERSTDTGSGAAGGELGCRDPSSYVDVFKTAVETATPGQVVGPVQSEFGYHVLIVTGAEADGDALASTALETGLDAATVKVDDRVGTWDASQKRITPAAS